MSSTGGLRPGEAHMRSRGTKAAADPLAERRCADLAKALAMAQIAQFVKNGLAQWDELGNGDIELLLISGETFHLGKTSIMRVS
jgi:hypothetical protein